MLRFQAEHPKEIARDERRRPPLGRRAGRRNVDGDRVAVRREPGEGTSAVAVIPVHRIGRVRNELRRVIHGKDSNEPLRLGKRQRAEEHGIDDRKNGRVRSDAEREDRYREQGEAGSAGESSRREPQVESPASQDGKLMSF